MEYPKVSVIIPVVNEANNIQKCLERLRNQTYPKDKLEIIVVDGMSKDKTREIIQAFKNGLSEEQSHQFLHIRLVDNLKGQRASALNIGIKEAKGNVIIRIDARAVILQDYIEKCVVALIKTGADNVGGIQKPIVDENLRLKVGMEKRILTQKAIGIAMSHPFGIGNAQFRLGKKSGFVDTVYLGCFKKEVFNKVGMFDEDSAIVGEDTDINQRIRNAGGRVYLNKDIVAYYYPRDNFKDLWKLYFRYGGARAGNLIKNKKFTAWRQLVPPAFWGSIISLILLSLFNYYFLYLLFLFLGTYFLVNILVSTYLTILYKNFAILVRLFIAFLILHFSWTWGFYRRLLQKPKPGQYWGY